MLRRLHVRAISQSYFLVFPYLLRKPDSFLLPISILSSQGDRLTDIAKSKSSSWNLPCISSFFPCHPVASSSCSSSLSSSSTFYLSSFMYLACAHNTFEERMTSRLIKILYYIQSYPISSIVLNRMPLHPWQLR